MATNTANSISSPPCLTHFETKGTHYDVGFSVGSHFRERIQLFFAESKNLQTIVLPFYDSPEGREYYEENLRVSQDCFPHYVRELRGLANGTGLPFEHIFMANVCEAAIKSLLKPKDTSNQPPPPPPGKGDYGCSTVLIHSGDDNNCQAIVHNEDHHPLIQKYGYLLTAHIVEEEEEDRKTAEGEGKRRLEEKFTSFCYPGSLPGRAFNVNHRGLVFTSNVLRPAELTLGAPSRIFHTRSILTARDIPEAVKLARNDPFGTAYGFSANLSTKEGQMASLEIGPGMPQAAVHVQEVTRPCGPDVRSPTTASSMSARHYYHFNAYQHLKVPELGQLESSLRRAQRASQLPAPRVLRQALDIMADTQDQVCPLYRTPRSTDQAQTVCTAVFDVLNNELRLYGDRDALLADTPALTLPLFD